MNIAINDLKDKIVTTFTKNGFSEQASQQVVDYLLWAEMSGNKTQGLVKMTGTDPFQDIKPQYEQKVLRDTQLSQLIDAGAQPAPIAASNGTQIAIEKAKASGIAIIGVKNTHSSNGAQAYYAEMIAREDLIGIVLSRSPASAAGFDSIDPIFGTNPIGFSFPTEADPLVFDMATSAMTFYGLVLAKAKGETIPEDVAIDHDGNPTTDPEAAMGGAILPFDRGYKGAGLGMVVEMLAGPLLDGAWIDNKTFKEEWGSVFIAIDPNLLVDTAIFKKNASDMITKIKAARTKSGASGIRLPGERATKDRKAAEASGYVDVDEAILKQLGYIS